MRSPSPLASLPRSLRALSVHSARHVMSISSLDFLVWHAPTFLELFPRLLGVQNIPLYRFVVLLPVKQADQFHIRLCGLAFGLWAIQRFVRHPGLGHVGGCRLAANKLSVTVNMQLPTSGQDSDEHRQNSSRACRPAPSQSAGHDPAGPSALLGRAVLDQAPDRDGRSSLAARPAGTFPGAARATPLGCVPPARAQSTRIELLRRGVFRPGGRLARARTARILSVLPVDALVPEQLLEEQRGPALLGQYGLAQALLCGPAVGRRRFRDRLACF